jgi:proteasome lid subunit RPN8/RPN11
MIKEILKWLGLSIEINAEKFYITDNLVNATLNELRSFGLPHKPHEGIVYWAGLRLDRGVVITTALVPDAITTPGSFFISAKANAEVTRFIMNNNLQLIGQIHSHPGCNVDHSLGDDENALLPFEGYLSFIVPNYARRGNISEWGFHVYEQGRFIRKQKEWREQKIIILPFGTDLRRVGELNIHV